MTPNRRFRPRFVAGIDTARQLGVDVRAVMGEDLVRYRPALVVHRGVIAGAVGDEILRIRRGVRRRDERGHRDQARREDSRHSLNAQRVIR